MRPSTYILLFFLLVLIFSTIVKNEAEAGTEPTIPIDVPVSVAERCIAEGGCSLITQAEAEKLFAYIALLERQAKEAKGKSCA